MSSKLIDERPLILLPSLAKKIGLNEAVFMQQIHFWLLMKKNVKDGYYWTYNTHDGWLEQFPFWSKSTLRRIIDSLIEKDLIICGRFNKKNYDKTKWYRINYDKLKEVTKDMEVFDGKATVQNEKATVQNEKATVQNEQMDVFKMDTPIPKTITKNNLKELNNNIKHIPEQVQDIAIKFNQFWELYRKKGGRKKSLEKFTKLLKKHSFEEIMQHTKKYMDYLYEKNGNFEYQKHCETFLNNFDLEDVFIVETKNNKNKVFNPYAALENEFNHYKEVNTIENDNRANRIAISENVNTLF